MPVTEPPPPGALLALWNKLPSAWLDDLQDARVRSDVVNAIFQNQKFSIYVHLIISAAYYFSYELVRNHYWIQGLLVIFVALSLARFWLQKYLLNDNLGSDESITYLFFGIFSSAMIAAIMSTLVVVFLNFEKTGFNSPVVFGGILYYFAAVIKNISMRAVTTIYSAVILLPIGIFFSLQNSLSEKIISIFIFTLFFTMTAFAKTMGKVFTSKIKQSYELEHLTQQLTQERDRADVANRSKSSFLAAASHDLRQPVHAIGLYLAALRQNPVPVELGHSVAGIHQSWAALDSLLAQILELSQAENTARQSQGEPIPLAPLMNALVMQYAMNAEKKNQRVVIFGKPNAQVWANGTMLRRVLANLLDNAIKYAPADTTIVLAVRSRGSHWVIQLRDAGGGIAPDDQEKIFDIFVQAGNPERARTGGYGIGLSIARQFVQAMGGRLELRSALGRGTCMGVLLPKAASVAQAWPGEPFVADGTAPSPDSKTLRLTAAARMRVLQSRKTILLVEDDPLVSDALAQVLATQGLPSQCVTDAVQAWHGVEHTLLAICDIRLPGAVSGLTLAQRLHARGIPVLLVSGEHLPVLPSGLKGIELPFLQKPVKAQELLDWIESVV